MQAGRLRDRVLFQAERDPATVSGIQDGGGGYTLQWRDLGEVWGELRLERGSEQLEAGRLGSATLGILKVRSSVFTKAITHEHRAVINGNPYQIRSNNNLDRRGIYRELVVETGVGT